MVGDIATNINGDVTIANIPLVEDIATSLVQWQRKVMDGRFFHLPTRATIAKGGTCAKCADGLRVKEKGATCPGQKHRSITWIPCHNGGVPIVVRRATSVR